MKNHLFILAIFVGVALIVQHIERDNLFSGRGGKQPRSGGSTQGHHRSTQGSDIHRSVEQGPELAALFNLTRVQQRVGFHRTEQQQQQRRNFRICA